MASPKPVKRYDFASQNILVAGRRLTGFDDDGTVSYEFEGDRWTHTAGADGLVTLSRVNDPRVVATLTIKETGKAYEILAQLHKKQKDPSAPGISYRHRDPFVGDVITSGSAFFLNRPGIEKASEAGSREFTLLLPNAAEQGIVMAGQNPEAGGLNASGG